MGTMLGCKAISKAMLASRATRREGDTACIINISSLLGVKGGQGATAYAASKAGVLGFTRALVADMKEFTNNIRFKAIMPGYVDTQMLEGKWDIRSYVISTWF